MWGGFDGWHCPIIDVPFVARHSARSAGEVRERLGVPPGHRVALASFGGLGITGLPLEPLARLDGWSVVTTAHALESVGPVPPGVRVIEDAAVYAWAFATKTSSVRPTSWSPSPDTASSPSASPTTPPSCTRTAAPSKSTTCWWRRCHRYLRARFMPREDLFLGRWQDHLDAVAAGPAPPERPRTDGALVAASHLLAAS